MEKKNNDNFIIIIITVQNDNFLVIYMVQIKSWVNKILFLNIDSWSLIDLPLSIISLVLNFFQVWYL